MVTISPSTRDDLPAVVQLLQQSGKMFIEDSHFNATDIALQARNDSGDLVGFVWCGLMCSGQLGYVDKLAVDLRHQGQGIGKLLTTALLRECVKRGVRKVITCIRQDQFHDASAFNALRMAMGADRLPYTFAWADIENTARELEYLTTV